MLYYILDKYITIPINALNYNAYDNKNGKQILRFFNFSYKLTHFSEQEESRLTTLSVDLLKKSPAYTTEPAVIRTGKLFLRYILS